MPEVKCCECGSSVESKGEMHRTVGLLLIPGYVHYGEGYATKARVYGNPRVNYSHCYTLIPKCSLDTSSQFEFILLEVQNTESTFLSDSSSWVGVFSILV